MLIDESQSCHLCCLSHTNSQGVGAGINMQPAYLSSAAHLEPVFMYKVRCVQVSLFSFKPKGM